MMKELFRTTWPSGCVNDQIIKWCKQNNIEWRYKMQATQLLINGQWVGTDYSYNKELDILKIYQEG